MPNANGELVKRIDMFVHFAELAATNNIAVKFTLADANNGGYQAHPRSKTIISRPIRNTGYYVSGLHEMGHILGPDQEALQYHAHGLSDILMSEWGAWRWAKENAITWTDTAERIMKGALTSYATNISPSILAAMPDDFFNWVNIDHPAC